jgi:hypothetical protein
MCNLVKGFLLLCTTALVASPVFSQTIIEALPRWMVSVHTEIMYPRQPIKEFLDGAQWGYRVEAQYRLQYNKPFMAGLYFNEAGLSKYTIKYTEMHPDGDLNIKEKATTRRLEGRIAYWFLPGGKLVVATLCAGKDRDGVIYFFFCFNRYR